MITARVLSLEQLEEIAGAECLAAMLSEFSCPLNKRVEEFIRENAIQSERLGSTVTYFEIADLDWTEINPTIFGAVFKVSVENAVNQENRT